MKYLNAEDDELETTINILYKEKIVIIYSSKAEVIRKITKAIGAPTKKYQKNKKYYTGASWNIDFADIEKIDKLITRNILVDVDSNKKKIEQAKIESIKKKKSKIRKFEGEDNKKYYQISLDLDK